MISILDTLRRGLTYAIIISIFFSTTIYLVNHFHIYREYGKVEDFANSAISIAQKNGGFYTMSSDSGAEVDSLQRQRVSFEDWASYSLSNIHDIKTNLKVTITSNGSSTTAIYDAKSGKFSPGFDKSSSAINGRTQRGDSFKIEIKPYYRKWNILPGKADVIEGATITKTGKAHAYIKVKE